MECLSAGRGISLPATANASSKVASFGIINYIKVRTQFKIPLSNMEAIQEKVNSMVYNTWIIQSAVCLTNTILDQGNSPAVLSAIMKQQTTERGREVLNHALDIHGGAGICLGYSNFLEKFYRAAPIGITVEGSNTLTRSLIIFGQGLNKSHPHIFPILESVLENDIIKFKKEFNSILLHSFKLYAKTFSIESNMNLEQQIINFACLTNFVALKGGALKSEQMLSGAMADIFSNLYLALGVQYYHNENNANIQLTDYVIQRLLKENQHSINKVIDNLGSERFFLQHLKAKVPNTCFYEERKIFSLILNDINILNELKKNIVLDNNILDDLLKANNLPKDSNEYKMLQHKIINVGEFENSE